MKQEHLCIAVTGHRDMVEHEGLAEDLALYFDALAKDYQHVTLLSPLAEGADRLVAKVFLEKREQYADFVLEVPMPFERARYEEDFDTTSCEVFNAYVKEASICYAVENEGYKALGAYLVDKADVLVALWDGTINFKEGGTSDVVAYAKEKNVEIKHFLVERKS